ncbi:DUF6119 family protein [Brucella gallinifaecis]|uniref:Sporadically distributed protein, TIGR04141 family n=1 Tax=Brucella gallinifaecis TaxID=215590 RepID=A0A502BGZ1_9HYPH|nr:DUF6119 family protein [Brucella gallinifaecis]TPF74052.1 sporadically distributed protein, TIGR04141 family [Brucella gallinifaecis]
MSKSRSFSIYLLKPTFDATNTIKEDNTLEDGIAASDLPEGATLHVLDSQPTPPWWRGYFGIQKNLMQALKGAIVFLPVGGRTFAITFGHVMHNLKPESYEYDFGLRVTLNSVDPEKLKSLDSLRPENARRQRTQLSVGSDLTLFDFDRDSTILRSLTGAVKEELEAFFRHATGASSIRISSDVGPEGLPDLCEKLLELYNDNAYATAFPDIQNVTPVKDPVLLDALNTNLVAAVASKDENVTLTIPDIVNYAEEMYATFTGQGHGLVYDDVFIDRYYEYLETNGFDVSTIDLEALKRHHLVITNESGQPKGDRPSILKCLIFDTVIAGNPGNFHLCEGNWYQVSGDYVTDLTTYLDPICTDTSLLAYDHDGEGAYNEACVVGENTRLCMDKGNVAPAGQKQVEPCDILEIDGDQVILHHVKLSTVSATLSHLFNQGLNSIQLIREHDEVFVNLRNLVTAKAEAGEDGPFLAAIDGKKFKVVFQIITHKDKSDKSLNLPLFSRISLRRTMRELRRMGIDAEFCFVENQRELQEGKKKQRKKKMAAQPEAEAA